MYGPLRTSFLGTTQINSTSERSRYAGKATLGQAMAWIFQRKIGECLSKSVYDLYALHWLFWKRTNQCVISKAFLSFV